MAFKVLFIAHAPDADMKKHRSTIVTGKYKLFSVVVKTQRDAVEVAKEIVEKEMIDSLMLCPGFTHIDVAEIANTVGNKVSVVVARGDGPSNRATMETLKREGFILT